MGVRSNASSIRAIIDHGPVQVTLYRSCFGMSIRGT